MVECMRYEMHRVVFDSGIVTEEMVRLSAPVHSGTFIRIRMDFSVEAGSKLNVYPSLAIKSDFGVSQKVFAPKGAVALHALCLR